MLAKYCAAGFAIETTDALVAAVAMANCFTVTTGDTSFFEADKLNAINPREFSQ